MKIASIYAFLFLNKEIKILFGPPPPKKRLRDTNVRDTATGYTDNSYEYTECTGGLLGIAQCVYSQLHAQVFVHSNSP